MIPIPFSISDLVKLLEQLPVWKAVKALPERLAELERRVAELEKCAGEAAKPAAALQCPLCQGEMRNRRKDIAELGRTLGAAGLTRRPECAPCSTAPASPTASCRPTRRT